MGLGTGYGTEGRSPFPMPSMLADPTPLRARQQTKPRNWEPVGNRAVAYSALYHNSFSGIAVHETWHGTSVGGGSLTSEREFRPIPFIPV
ncbi:unnamed protein product [Cochlearia groenlandica]